MINTIRIKDQLSFGGTGSDEYALNLHFSERLVTPREIIRARVFTEVGSYNETRSETFKGLVQPVGAERILNGFKMKERKKIDPHEQYKKAIEAFEHSGFVMLVDDLQIETLDEQIEIAPDMEVTFLKLVPLVGG